jgi:hypothetical protein
MSTLSCLLSRAPIRDGEDAYLVLLGRAPTTAWGGSPASMGPIYPSDLWTPLCLPLAGTATSTHTFDLKDGFLPTVFFSTILPDWAMDLPAGNNPIHEQAVRAADLTTLEAALDALHGNRLLLTPPAPEMAPIPVARAFFSKTAYDTASATVWRSNSDGAGYVGVALEDILASDSSRAHLLADYHGDAFNNLLRTPQMPYDCRWIHRVLTQLVEAATDEDGRVHARVADLKTSLERDMAAFAAVAEVMAWGNIAFAPGYIASEDGPEQVQQLLRDLMLQPDA